VRTRKREEKKQRKKRGIWILSKLVPLVLFHDILEL
jgi:hypothetical protein